MTDQSTLKKIFSFKTIAVVGLSPNISRPSSFVSAYMENKGYRIFPVNPRYNNIGNNKCYKGLIDIRQKIDIINIFRKSEHVLPIIDDSIKIGAKAIWMQDGILIENAKEIAEKNNLIIVMNDCIMRQHLSFKD